MSVVRWRRWGEGRLSSHHCQRRIEMKRVSAFWGGGRKIRALLILLSRLQEREGQWRGGGVGRYYEE